MITKNMCPIDHKELRCPDKNIKESALLYFHQGWTDIINCLAMINYYKQRYKELFLLIREDSKEIIEFYVKNLNVTLLFFKKESSDKFSVKQIENIHNIDLSNTDILGIGHHSHMRNNSDPFKGAFSKNKVYFVERFYTSYDIPYISRINYFEFERNLDMENNKYNEFINNYGVNYILTHEDVVRNLNIKKFIENKNKYNIVDLNKKSDIFFDMILILQNAFEIHLIDSIWAAFIYLLDAKYNLFSDKQIYLYALRGHRVMFSHPIKLLNWKIINKKNK